MLDPNALVSIVIPNFNYRDYIGDAIDSALAIDWPRLEVIVVDDGSTDDSRRVIERYGDRVRALFQENRGHATACAAGWLVARGEVILFLDSDDVFDPGIIRAMAPVWRPKVTKVQFQMRTVDGARRPLGTFLPQYRTAPTPTQCTEWFRQSGAYPTPPGSGNAYARWFIEAIGEIELGVDRAMDSLLLPLAPLYGDVVTIASPLVEYRVHGRNSGAQQSFDPTRPGREARRTQARWTYAQRHAKRLGIDCADDALRRNLQVLEYRAASIACCPDQHPVADDRRWKILRDGVLALTVGQGRSLVARLSQLAWILAVCVTPASLNAHLLSWRYVPRTRPRALQRALRLAGAVR